MGEGVSRKKKVGGGVGGGGGRGCIAEASSTDLFFFIANADTFATLAFKMEVLSSALGV